MDTSATLYGDSTRSTLHTLGTYGIVGGGGDILPVSRSSEGQSTPLKEKNGLKERRSSVEKRDVDSGAEPVQEEPTPTPRPMSTFRACVLVATVTFAMILHVANSTAVSIAAPTIAREMDLEPAELQWVVDAYPLSSACLLLLCGRLADVYGRKKAFLAGSFILCAFSIGCAFAKDVMVLDILRALAGIGGAIIIPAGLGILAHSFPPSRARSFAFATFAAGGPIGAVFGSVVGGVVTQYSQQTWRGTFYVLAAITALCFTGAYISIDADHVSAEKDKRIDWFGAFLVTAALVLIVFVLSQGELASKQWSTDYIIALLIVGVFLLALFLLWQRHLERALDRTGTPYSIFTPPPLLRLTLFTRANGRYGAMMAIAFVNWCSFLTWVFWVQLYYQHFMHYTAMQTVVRLLPMFVSGMLCNIFVGFMSARVPVVYLVAGGAFATALSNLLFAIIEPDASYWTYSFFGAILTVMGADFVFAAGTLFIAQPECSKPHEQSVGGALFNTMNQIGTAVGITVSTVVFNRVGVRDGSGHGGEGTIEMYRAAFWTGFAFGIAGTIVGIICFTGTGVIGHRTARPSSSASDEEKGGSIESAEEDEKVIDEKDDRDRIPISERTGIKG